MFGCLIIFSVVKISILGGKFAIDPLLDVS